MKFSIIVPTYNEEQDIKGTLEALLALDYPDKEILIVDDSTDRTPVLVKEYESKGVKLIHPGGGGRCEARNLGVRAAEGEVVCILNADVRPRPDYLNRILVHYEKGADYVLVGALISNQRDLFARYVESVSALWAADIKDDREMEWTEGFSCRKSLAIEAGLFPTGFIEPIVAGEDGYFGTNIRNLGAKKVIDYSVVVDHVAPAKFSEYWHIRKGRGKGSAQVHRFLDQWSYAKIIFWNLLKTVKTTLYCVTLLPAMAISWQASRYSPRKNADFFPFLYAWFIEQLAFHAGEWQSTFNIWVKENKHVAKR